MQTPFRKQPKSVKQIIKELILKEMEKEGKKTNFNIVVIPTRVGQSCWGTTNLRRISPTNYQRVDQGPVFSPINCTQISPITFSQGTPKNSKTKQKSKYQKLLKMTDEQPYQYKKQQERYKTEARQKSLSLNTAKNIHQRLPSLPRKINYLTEEAKSLQIKLTDTIEGYQVHEDDMSFEIDEYEIEEDVFSLIRMLLKFKSVFLEKLFIQIMNKIKRKLFSMEAILDSRTINDQLYFLVKWAGYPISQSTWEKADKVPVDSNMISEYKMSVQMLGKTFYFDPLDQPPQIEDFVDIPPEKSELSTFNTKLSEFQHQINTLRDDVRFILQSQLKLIKELKMSKNAIHQYDLLRSPASQEKQQSIQSDMMQQSASINYDGSFDQGDKVEKIGRAVQIKKSKTKMYYILWKRRSNGQIPKNSWVESEQMIENDPSKVCQYLWNKII